MKSPVRFLSALALGLLALAPGARSQALYPNLVATFPAGVSNVTGGLVQDSAGNFYGTDAGDGSTTFGSVFQVTPAGVFTTLHTFSGGADGGSPDAALLVGSDGSFYGTTATGGSNGGYGTVFRLTPGGTLTTLHSFNLTDGRAPQGGVVAGPGGFLYGATVGGGTSNTGTFYKIATDGSGFASLHSFVQGEGTAPQASPILGSDNNFYGTAAYNGTPDDRAAGDGSVYRITPAGTLTVLRLLTDATDGSEPFSPPVQGGDGAFYGVNPNGGANGSGTVWRVTSAGAFSVIYAFSATDEDGFNGDGAEPTGALADGDNGSLYGVANLGGPSGTGTVFAVTATGALATVYGFGATDANDANGTGAFPFAGFLRGADGQLYVPLPSGGANGTGTILSFNLNGSAHPPFFAGQASLGSGVYYLALPDGNVFGYYSFLSDPNYLYHFDLGYEYVFDAADGKSGVYFYDFKAGDFLYTSPGYPFPYLYDFTLNSVLYYYPDPSDPGHYNTNGVRYFYDFATGQIITR